MPDLNGVLVKRRMHFLGRRIRWGGVGGLWHLRLWRHGRGQCEQRWMDEHIVVEGGVARSKIIIDDINLNSLTWWTRKHNWYASLEAIETLLKDVSRADQNAHCQAKLSLQAAIKRWLKHAIYLRLPLGTRAALYFIYRYVLLLGFLDGREGYYFHYLQGYWYRTLVDAKINEIQAVSRRDGVSLSQAILDCTGIEIAANEAYALDVLDAKKLMVRKP